MGTWHEIEDYENYIRTQTNPADAGNLLHPRNTPVGGDYPTILIGYDSMSDWMDLLDIINTDKNATEFRRLRGIYQADKDKYRDNIIALINQIAGQLSGRALLDELRATGRTLVILPYHDEDDPVNATADASTRAGRQERASGQLEAEQALHRSKRPRPRRRNRRRHQFLAGNLAWRQQEQTRQQSG